MYSSIAIIVKLIICATKYIISNDQTSPLEDIWFTPKYDDQSGKRIPFL